MGVAGSSVRTFKTLSCKQIDKCHHLSESVTYASGQVRFRAWETKSCRPLYRRWRYYFYRLHYMTLADETECQFAPALPFWSGVRFHAACVIRTS